MLTLFEVYIGIRRGHFLFYLNVSTSIDKNIFLGKNVCQFNKRFPVSFITAI